MKIASAASKCFVLAAYFLGLGVVQAFAPVHYNRRQTCGRRLSRERPAAVVRPRSTERGSNSVLVVQQASDLHDSSDTTTVTTGVSQQRLKDTVLQSLESLQSASNEYAATFDLGPAEAAFYGLFRSLRQANVPLGLKAAVAASGSSAAGGGPLLFRHAEIQAAFHQETTWRGFFSMDDLEKAVSDDFLDAARGSTDNRKGWKITDVSVPRGESFDEARMTFADVQAALDKGTVILNAAGAHIPKLAGPSLAVTDAVALPCALNMYVTAAGKRTSAPPHTDKQDVCVVQTAGCKHWKVFAPPDAAMKPAADIFARGKGDDSMPLYALSETTELLLETTLYPGDVLFVPAGFPHTTSTVGSDDADTADETSVHLTLGIDHHIWELDFLSVRRVAYRRACITDTILATGGTESNPFTGPVNQLPFDILADVMAELPLGFLEDEGFVDEMVDQVAKEAESIARKIDPECSVDAATWKETVQRIRQQGVELLETHRDMYLAALEEGRIRDAEDAMTAHLKTTAIQRTMSPERMQRLSLFRVKRYYDQINDSKQRLKEWSFRGKAAELTASSGGALSSDWAFTMPVVVGDQVEADLGGAFFPAKVTRASDGTFDVAFFDGDRETGLARRQIKLLSPPKTAAAASLDEVDTSNMTAKQLKRWKKEQEKLQKNGL